MKNLIYILLLLPALCFSQPRTPYKSTAQFKSNTRLFFPAGTTVINDRVNLSGISNLTLEGEPGTVILTTQRMLFQLYGDNKKITFRGITFISSDQTQNEDSEGIITNNNLQGSTGTLDGLTVDNCTFIKSKSNSNGIKINSEGTGVAKNIRISHSRFIGVGRFAIETQNHIETDKIQRVQNVEVVDCYFENIGTMGTWGLAVSISGYSYNVKVNNNVIVDVGWDKGKTQWDYYAIENAGASKWQSNYNIIRSNRYGFKGILCSNPRPKTDVQIIGNSFDLRGEKTNAIEMNNVSKALVKGNNGTVDGLAYLLNNVSNSAFSWEDFKCNYPSAVMIQQGSTGNSFSNSSYDNSASKDKWGTILFLDKGTTGNIFTNIKVIGGGYGNLNGATNATY